MTHSASNHRRQVALYRFQVIAPLLPPQLSAQERALRLDAILQSPPLPTSGGPAPPLSRRTVLRWLRAYRDAMGDRLRALERKARCDRGVARRVPPELLAEAISLRERAARLSVKEILKRTRHEASGQVARRSVARAMRAAGYDRKDKRRRIAARTKGPTSTPDWDLHSWEADFPNAIWQVDSTPSIWLAAGVHREQPVRLHLVNLIDDHSRLVTGGGFTEKLGVTDLLAFLVPAIARYGCPSVLFVDQAKVHKAKVLVEGLARLEGTVVFGTAGHAPGHGKVERIHQIVESTLLEDLRLAPVQTAEEATERHALWRERHNDEEHGETEESPRSRWQRILGNARIPSPDELAWAFRAEVERTVSELGAIHLNGRVYEAPSSHRRRTPHRVQLRFDLLDHTQVWIEDPDGTHHRCPLYRRRNHTERRRKRRRSSAPSGLRFADLFDDTEASSDVG